MAVAVTSRARVSVDGKFFRLGEKKFYVKGLAYGPFAPNAGPHGSPRETTASQHGPGPIKQLVSRDAGFASPEQTAGDLAQIHALGANLIRVYQVPAKWFLELAAEHELKVLIDIPWNKHLCV